MEELAEFFHAGGIWMYPIVLVSIAVIAVGVERFYALFFKYNVNADALMAQVQKLVLANNVDRAIKLCNVEPHASLPKVIKAALTRANRGEAEIASALEEATVEVLRSINARTGLLPSLSNMATLCGLLGTIVALIEAFTAVAAAPPDMKSQLLTQSLAIGLNSTALGLVVAIPALAIYMFLATRARKIVEDIDQYSLKLQNLLAARARQPYYKPESGGANPHPQ